MLFSFLCSCMLHIFSLFRIWAICNILFSSVSKRFYKMHHAKNKGSNHCHKNTLGHKHWTHTDKQTLPHFPLSPNYPRVPWFSLVLLPLPRCFKQLSQRRPPALPPTECFVPLTHLLYNLFGHLCITNYLALKRHNCHPSLPLATKVHFLCKPYFIYLLVYLFTYFYPFRWKKKRCFNSIATRSFSLSLIMKWNVSNVCWIN